LKLPKTLLSAILIGIAVQTATSCKKEKDLPNSQKEEKKEDEKKPPYYCPACGMG
jgi:hypothetical protein